MEVKLVDFNKNYLDISWNWLLDSELRKMIQAPIVTKEKQLKWFKIIKGKKDYLIWGIEVDTKPIGACGIKNISSSKGEYWGYIGEKSYRGKGIGEMMMSLIIEKAKELKLKKIYLKVLNENILAIKLYKKFDFVTADNQKDTIIMHKIIIHN